MEGHGISQISKMLFFLLFLIFLEKRAIEMKLKKFIEEETGISGCVNDTENIVHAKEFYIQITNMSLASLSISYIFEFKYPYEEVGHFGIIIWL